MDPQQELFSYLLAALKEKYPDIGIYDSFLPRQRGTVSGLLLGIKELCYRLESTKNFGWDLRNADQRILADTTTAQPLLHGVLEIEFKFN